MKIPLDKLAMEYSKLHWGEITDPFDRNQYYFVVKEAFEAGWKAHELDTRED